MWYIWRVYAATCFQPLAVTCSFIRNTFTKQLENLYRRWSKPEIRAKIEKSSWQSCVLWWSICWLLWSASYSVSTFFYVYFAQNVYIWILSIWNAWTNVRSEFPTQKKENSLHYYIFANTYYSFQTIALQRFGRSPSDHCRQGHLTPPPSRVFCSNWKWTGTTPTHFRWLSNISQPSRDVWKGESPWPDVFFCAWIDSDGGHFEHLLWILTSETVRY